MTSATGNNPMTDLIEVLVAEWIYAERAEGARHVALDAQLEGRVDERSNAEFEAAGMRYNPLTEGEIAIALERVHQVLAGEVRWSETTAGDRAIWRSRLRNVDAYLAHRGTDREDAVLTPDGVQPGRGPARRRLPDHEFVSWNFYDTLALNTRYGIRSAGRTHMFGNANVGNIRLTNLFVAGVLSSDHSTYIHGYYVHVDHLDAMHWLAKHMTFEVRIGEKPVTPTMKLSDLVLGWPLRIPTIVAVRQSFTVSCDMWADFPSSFGPVEVSFHVDCTRGRSVY